MSNRYHQSTFSSVDVQTRVRSGYFIVLSVYRVTCLQTIRSLWLMLAWSLSTWWVGLTGATTPGNASEPFITISMETSGWVGIVIHELSAVMLKMYCMVLIIQFDSDSWVSDSKSNWNGICIEFKKNRATSFCVLVENTPPTILLVLLLSCLLLFINLFIWQILILIFKTLFKC